MFWGLMAFLALGFSFGFILGYVYKSKNSGPN